MSVQSNDNFNILAPKAMDERSGKFVSGSWSPYTSITEANTSIHPAYRHSGLTVYVNVGGFLVEYVYKNGISDNHLVPKGNVRVMGTGSDMTSALNSLLAVSSISSITFGSSQSTSIIINGILNAGNKNLIFENGSYISGSGTISGGIISAPSTSNILSTSVNLVNVKTKDNIFWCEWFGAIGDNGTDNTLSIQKAATYVCNNTVGCKNLRIGAGIFRIQKGINFFRDTNGNGDPEFVNFTFKGNLGGYEFTGSETVIRCMHLDNFAINIQKGKGCVISDMSLEGQNTLNYPQLQAFGGATYAVVGVRTNNQSPYAGIVLDAFGASTVGTNRYPGFESFYAGVVGNGGSTDCKFYNIAINGFYVGIILSPNANTQNNEAHTFDGIWMANLRDGFVTTNSQERTVRCINFKFWNSVHTCCRTNGYGANRGEVPFIDTWNIAGNIYQIFHLGGVGGYFPVVAINKVYAESFYWIGYVGGVTVNFKDCHFAFVDIKQVLPSLKTQNFLYVGSSMVFDNCILITYNGAERVPYNVFGRTKFTNCFLSNPVCYPTQNWTNDFYEIEYDHCRFYCESGFISNGSFESSGSGYYSITYGAQTEIATYNKEYCSYRPNTYNLNSANYFSQYRKVKSPTIRKVPIGNAVNVTVTGNTAVMGSGLSFVPPEGVIIYAKNLALNNGLSTSSGYAIMRHTSGGNCDRVIEGMFTQGYDLYYLAVNYINPIGFCDVTGTSVTNVVMERQTTLFDIGTGPRLFSNLMQIVTSSSSGSATLVNNSNIGNTTEVILSNYEYEEYGTSYCNPLQNAYVALGTAFTRGSFYKNIRGVAISIPVGAANAVGWLCIRSGVKGSVYPPVFLQQNSDGSYE